MPTLRSLLVVTSLAAAAEVVGAEPLAGFIDQGLYSSDTVTGLDWLDTTLTQGQSYLDVLAGGYIASGWRYATASEVNGLFVRYIAPQSPVFQRTGFENAVAMIRQMGVTYSWNNAEGTISSYGAAFPIGIMTGGRFDDGTTNSYVGIAQVVADFAHFGDTDLQAWLARGDEATATQSLDIPAYGSFLVRNTTAIPEPISLFSVLSGLLALWLARRSYHSRCRQGDA